MSKICDESKFPGCPAGRVGVAFMHRAAALVLLLMATSFGIGQIPVLAQDRSSSASDQAGRTLPLELAKSLDSRKLKPGDPVEARVIDQWRAGDGTLVPPGAKVLGHVTQSSARAKGDTQSQLGIDFDQIALKDGRKLPLKASIQAVGPPPVMAPMPMGGPGASAAGAGAPTGAEAPTGQMGRINPGSNPTGAGIPASTFPRPGSSSGNDPNSPPDNQNSPQVTPQSTGVIGLHDLQLEQGSVLASDGKQVKLQAGSQILLRVQDQ
jgi:hypothetical protein